jgi:S1-C subfamily serine protease
MKKLLLILLCLPFIGFGQSSGTGFAINSQGYIATNFHVIDEAKNIQVVGVNGKYQKSYTATIVRIDKSNDLAILKIDVDLGDIPYGFKRNKEDVAATVYAYGYPLPKIQGYEIKITDGIINSNSGLKDDPRWYQHTASIQPGNSGGPLLNKHGDLVGINNAGINNEALRKNYGTETTNVNYAIKSRYLYNLMEDLELSSFGNSGINKFELSEQYKRIRKFVYFISVTNGKASETLVETVENDIASSGKHILVVQVLKSEESAKDYIGTEKLDYIKFDRRYYVYSYRSSSLADIKNFKRSNCQSNCWIKTID